MGDGGVWGGGRGRVVCCMVFVIGLVNWLVGRFIGLVDWHFCLVKDDDLFVGFGYRLTGFAYVCTTARVVKASLQHVTVTFCFVFKAFGKMSVWLLKWHFGFSRPLQHVTVTFCLFLRPLVKCQAGISKLSKLPLWLFKASVTVACLGLLLNANMSFQSSVNFQGLCKLSLWLSQASVKFHFGM